VTTESVTGWLQYTDAAAVPTGIGAVSAQVGQAIFAVGYDVCIGSIASIPACPRYVRLASDSGSAATTDRLRRKAYEHALPICELESR
jgi:hypothetical protein